MSSFSLSGGVQVFGFISPSDTTDQYPVIDPLYGIDGFRNVDTLSDLNNIPTLRRRAGMVVGVSGGTTYYKLNLPPWNNTITDWSIFNSGGSSGGTLSGDYLPLSGGTVTGGTEFTNGLTANTISATTYLNLPLDVYVTGGTYNPNIGEIIFTNNSGNTFTVNGFITGFTDTFVTGGTYSNGTATFTNNTGGTFNVVGFYTGETSYVNSLTTGVGLSGDSTSGNITIINTNPDQIVTISGGTGIITGGTYPNFEITNSLPDQTVILNNGSNISVTGTYPNFTISATGLTDNDKYVTGYSYNNNVFTISDNSGSTYTATINSVTGLTVNGNLTVTGTTSSNIISATTYQNLPTDVTVTGGTYSNGTLTFTNNTGGTFNVIGLISADTFTTAFTYSNNVFTINRNQGQSNLTATINSVTGLTVNGNLTITGTTTSSTISATTYNNLPIEIQAAASDETTAITIGTAKVTFRAPCGFTLTGVRASLTTAQTSGNIFTVDINLNGTSVLSTKITIDNTERTSTTAVTPPIISTTSITDDGEITVDVDQIGDGTAKGLKVTLLGVRI